MSVESHGYSSHSSLHNSDNQWKSATKSPESEKEMTTKYKGVIRIPLSIKFF